MHEPGVGRTIACLLLILLLAAMHPGFKASMQAGDTRGPPLDEVLVTMYSDYASAVDGIVGGTYDALVESMPWSTYESMPPSTLTRLSLIRASTSSFSLLFNPVENVYADGILLPGLVNDTAGTLHFNPFALRKARLAVNYLMDRDHISDSLMPLGEPSYMAVEPSSPAYPMVLDLVGELGLTRFGNTTRAQELFNESLSEANTTLIPEGYMIVSQPDPTAPAGYWWVLILPDHTAMDIRAKFYIRNDDERQHLGSYIAVLIERYFAIHVDEIYADKTTCFSTVYGSDPAGYEWNIYTERWGKAGEAINWARLEVAQFYASWAGWMPGFQVPGWWQYRNSTIDDLSHMLVNGSVSGTDEYWGIFRELVLMGIQESIRVFVSEAHQFSPVSKDTVTGLVPGVITGIMNPWWPRTLNTTSGTTRIGEQGMEGFLLQGWNPVYRDTGMYDSMFSAAILDYALLPHPRTGYYVPLRIAYSIDEKAYHISGDEGIVGDLDVPSSAMIYNTSTKSWENVAGGTKAAVKVVFNYMFSNWHDGHPMTMADVLYEFAFMWEWSSQDGPDDPLYERYVEWMAQHIIGNITGIEVVNDTAIAVYGSYLDPAFDDATAAFYAVWPQYPWQLYEALIYCILNGGPVSGNSYSWTPYAPGTKMINLLEDTADIRAAYQALNNTGYIPPPLSGVVTIDEARMGYEAGLGFMGVHGHAVISNGPFILDEYTDTSLIRLTAFRDPSYPFTPTDFYDMLGIMPGEPVDKSESHEVVSGTGSVETENLAIGIETSGATLVSVTEYADEPVGGGGLSSPLGFFEIEVSDEDSVAWPMNVEYHYTDDEVAALGVPEDTLAIFFYNSTTGAYQRCSSTGVDTVNNVVWANITMEEYMSSGIIIGVGSPPPVVGGSLLPGRSLADIATILPPLAALACLLAIYASLRRRQAI